MEQQGIVRKRQRFNAMLAYGKLMDAKPHILEGFGVSSTMDLSELQLDAAIKRVNELISGMKQSVSKEVRDWRHKCLRAMVECGVNTQDWNAVNAFMMDKRIAGKHLYELNVEEMKTLHRKLHNVRDRKIEKQKEVNRLATLN